MRKTQAFRYEWRMCKLKRKRRKMKSFEFKKLCKFSSASTTSKWKFCNFLLFVSPSLIIHLSFLLLNFNIIFVSWSLSFIYFMPSLFEITENYSPKLISQHEWRKFFATLKKIWKKSRVYNFPTRCCVPKFVGKHNTTWWIC